MDLPQITDQHLATLFTVHRSALNEHPEFSSSNERLEFLGDAVLELATSMHLFSLLPNEPEGSLTAFRSALVKTTTLASVARKYELGTRMQMSFGEEKMGGRENDALLANTFEAYLGALYLDQGYDAVYHFLEQALFPLFPTIRDQKLEKDFKSRLQELLQSEKQPLPVYRVVKEEGPEHKKSFTIELSIGEKIVATAIGKTKQDAQQIAAKNALEMMGKT